MGDLINNDVSLAITGPQAFFWLVCLALNSVSQSSGTISGLSYKHRAILRSSPLLCAIDAVDMIVTSIIITLVLKGPRKSATQILSQRFHTNEDGELKHTIQDLKKHVGCRWIVFGLGVVPQAIKLFASKGIVAIKVFGGMYLASWLIFEALAALADPEYDPLTDTTDTTDTRRFSTSKLRRWWGIFGVIAHATFVIVLPLYFLMNFAVPLKISLLVLCTAGFIPPVWFWVVQEGDFRRLQRPGKRAYHLSSLSQPFIYAALAVFLRFGSYESLWVFLLSYFLSAFVFFLLSFIVCRCGKQGAQELMVAALLFLSILSSPICYFVVFYNPSGSYRRWWMDWLG